MNTIWKKTMVLLLAGIMAFSVTACSRENKENNASLSDSGSDTSNKPVKLRILWWGSQSRHDATLKALELYTKHNPNITFEPDFSGWEGYWDKLSTQAAAKNAPDIIQMDAAYLAEYASRKQLADLSEGINTQDMSQALVDSGKYNDKLYGIALGNNAYGMAYNKAAIEKLGIKLPQNEWTWDDYFNMGREAKAKLGANKYVLLDHSTILDIYGIYQLSKGKGYYVTDDGKFNIDKATWIDWQNCYADLRKEGVVPPPEVTVTDKELDLKMDLMANGTTMIRHMHAAQSGAVNGLLPNAVGMVTMPRDKEPGGWLKPSMFWSVSADSKYIEESKKFIDWFINNKEAADILGATRGAPVSKTILSYLVPKFNAADKMGIELINNTAKAPQSFHPDPKGWPNFRDKDYKVITEKVMFGKLTPEQAYDELVQKAKEYE